jgi:hypothetical protein
MTVDYENYPFQIKEHVVVANHFREYPQAVLEDGWELKFCLKQYTPRTNPNPSIGDITFNFSPGVGFLKESSLTDLPPRNSANFPNVSRNYTSPCLKIYIPAQHRRGFTFAISGLQI